MEKSIFKYLATLVSLFSVATAEVSINLKSMLNVIPYDNKALNDLLTNYGYSDFDLSYDKVPALNFETTIKIGRVFLNFQNMITGYGYDYTYEEYVSYPYYSYIKEKKGSEVGSFLSFINIGLSFINSKYININFKGGIGFATHSLTLYSYNLTNDELDTLQILQNPGKEITLTSASFLGNIGGEINLFFGPISLNFEGGYIKEFSQTNWVFDEYEIEDLPKIKIEGPYLGVGLGLIFR